MPENGFSLTRTFPYKNRIVNSVLIQEMQVGENLHSGIFYAVFAVLPLILDYSLLQKFGSSLLSNP